MIGVGRAEAKSGQAAKRPMAATSGAAADMRSRTIKDTASPESWPAETLIHHNCAPMRRKDWLFVRRGALCRRETRRP